MSPYPSNRPQFYDSGLRSTDAERFGFNGQESDFEIESNSSMYTAEFWEYDARLGRRWNQDPKPNPAVSNYAAFLNNPILLSDPKGDTTYRFNSKGIFQGMADLDQGGIRGAIGFNKTVQDAEGKDFQQWETTRNFDFNDPQVDKEQLNFLEVGEKGLTIVSDENINWVMNQSAIHPRGFIDRWDFAAGESVGGRMDFNLNYTLPSQGIESAVDVQAYDTQGGFMLMGYTNTAYNLNDAGQFLWGQAMNRLGFDYSSAKVGSELFARGWEWSWDAPGDQKAIRHGFFYKPVVKTAVAGTFDALGDFGRRPRRR